MDHSTGFIMEKPLPRDTVFDIALLLSTVPFGLIAAVVVLPMPRGACDYPEAADVGGGPSRHDRPAADGCAQAQRVDRGLGVMLNGTDQ